MKKESLTCKQHKRLLQMFCYKCNCLVCSKCLPAHTDCGCPVDLLDYASENLSAQYVAKINELDTADQITDESIKEAFVYSRKVKQQLIYFKAKLMDVLKLVDKNLEQLDIMEYAAIPSKTDIRRKLVAQLAEVKAAVEAEDFLFIANKVSGKSFVTGLGDGEKIITETLSKTMLESINLKQLDVLNALLYDFSSRMQLLMPDYISSISNDFVYGTCAFMENHKRLCKYDIKLNKLSPLIAVPHHCSVVQAGTHVFVSGGSNPVVNTMFEFIDNDNALVLRAPMTYARYAHALQKINDKVIVALGGDTSMSNKSYIPYCEEYLIDENRWEMLPSMNSSRAYLSAVLLSDKLLYAIGKPHTGNDIEVLNYNEKRVWLTVNVRSEIHFTSSPASIGLSKNEILILCGNNSSNSGIFNTKTNEIKNCKVSNLSDYFFHNTVSIIGKKAYVFGSTGNMHVFCMETRRMEEHPYESLIS